MRTRARTLLIIGVAAIVVSAAIAWYVWPMVMPVAATGDHEVARQRAEAFVKDAARGNVVAACLSVIQSGGVLNQCDDHMRTSDDFKRLADLDDGVRVRQVHISGDSATVTSADLSPEPTRPFEITLYNDPSPAGGWRVRELNGHPIAWR